MPTIKDNVFCEMALRQGAIAEEKLRQAEETLVELDKFGISKFIGAVLIEKKLAPREAVVAISESLHELSLRCSACGTTNEVDACDRHGNLVCSGCNEPIRLREGRIPEEDLGQFAAKARGGARKPRAAEPKPSPPATHQQEATRKPESGGGPGKRPRRRSEAPAEKRISATYPDVPARPSDITKFQVESLVGAGSSGRLYRIRETGEFGALKVLDRALCASKPQFKKWTEYMERALDLPRSATLKPMQLCKEGTTSYIVRPYLKGAAGPLRSRIDKGEPMDVRAAVDLSLSLLQSLSAFQSLRLVHGNIKPENVIVGLGAAQLTDPGVHLLLAGLPPEERLLRLSDGARYQAPEVMQGNEPTCASDVYSAGRIIEEILARVPASPSEDGSTRLRNLVEKMTLLDPAERCPSVKDALRDLQKKDDPSVERKGPHRRARLRLHSLIPGRGVARGELRVRLLGAALLALVAAGAIWQTVVWYSARSALASPLRDEQISDRLISRDVQATVHWMRTAKPGRAAAESRWSRLIELVRGTPWEERVRRAADQALERLPRPYEDQARALLKRAREDAASRKWIPALESVLAVSAANADDPRALEEGRELRDRIRQGLLDDVGMVLVPARGDSKPFLVDASLVSRKAGPAKNDAAGEIPLIGLSLSEVRDLARSSGKRIPTAAEWDRLATLSPEGDEWEAFAASKLGLGSLFQWVESPVDDELSRAGLGECRGGNRTGISPTHPLRRNKGYGYPDVGVRFVKDVSPPEIRAQ